MNAKMMNFLNWLTVALVIFFTIQIVVMASESNINIVEAISCKGNKTTSCEIIKREIYLEPGDRLDYEEIQNAKYRLSLLGLFEDVYISLQKGSAKNHVVIVVEVEEENYIQAELTLGLTYHKDEGNILNIEDYNREYSARVSHLNLFGLGKKISLAYTYLNRTLDISTEPYTFFGNYYSGQNYKTNYSSSLINVSYQDPHLFSHKRIFFNADLNYRFNYYGIGYFEENYGNDIFNFSNNSKYIEADTELGFRLFNFSYVSFSAESMWKKDVREGDKFRRIRSNFGLHYGWNGQDDDLFPRYGSLARFSAEVYDGHNSKNSDLWRWIPFNINWKKHFNLFENHIVTHNAHFNLSNLRYIEKSSYISFYNEILYRKIFNRDMFNQAIRNSEFYVGPTFSFYGKLDRPMSRYSTGVKVGVLLDTTWTLVNLYLIGRYSKEKM